MIKQKWLNDCRYGDVSLLPQGLVSTGNTAGI